MAANDPAAESIIRNPGNTGSTGKTFVDTTHLLCSTVSDRAMYVLHVPSISPRFSLSLFLSFEPRNN